MCPEEECKIFGFELEVEYINNRQFYINVLDPEKLIFKTGIRKGTVIQHDAIKEMRLKKTWGELFQLILDKLFD